MTETEREILGWFLGLLIGLSIILVVYVVTGIRYSREAKRKAAFHAANIKKYEDRIFELIKDVGELDD